MPHPIVDTISQKIEKLVILKIVTVVGEVDPMSTTTASGKAARTRIDLLDGDITTELDPSFVGGEYDAVREFHLSREKEGQAIIQANIKTLTELVKLAQKLANPSEEGSGVEADQ